MNLAIGLGLAIVLIFFNDLIIPGIKIYFGLDEKSLKTFLILTFIYVFTIGICLLLFSWFFYTINKTLGRKYFNRVDFKEPTANVIIKALNGILETEKTEPYFVHVAPVPDEIELIYQKLDTEGFVWENGRPGEGKSMLAYHSLYRYKKPYKIFGKTLFRRKCKIYALDLAKINDKQEKDAILEELDYLKGGKRKIILIDDAHKLPFENVLRYEFEEEAKEKLNGKFIWINTNYLEEIDSDASNLITVEFASFYPKLLSDLYYTDNLIIKSAIDEKCPGLPKAIKLVDDKKVKDPWHFNFIATEGEKRILDLLKKLSKNRTEQDILILAIFLFSVRNIITREKDITQTEFMDLLGDVANVAYNKAIIDYTPAKIIADLASQDKGRFLIIENKTSLKRSFLKAPHINMSISIVRTIIEELDEDEVFIKKLINASQILLTDNYNDSIHFGIYFSLLGNHQYYFLEENKTWIKNFVTNLIPEQLHVYPFLLNEIKKNHSLFFQELLTDEYFDTIASQISLAPSGSFQSIGQFLKVFGKEKTKLIKRFDFEVLTKAANKAKVNQLKQLADFLVALGNEKKNIKLDYGALAKEANTAKVNQLKQLAEILVALGGEKEKLLEKLDYGALGKVANTAKVVNFAQFEAILTALGDKKGELLKKLDYKALRKEANTATVNQLSQLADFITALGDQKEGLIKEFDYEALGKAANTATVNQLNQLADFIIALGDKKEELLKFIDTDWLLNCSRMIESNQVRPFCIILSKLDEEKQKYLAEKIDWISVIKKLNLNHSTTTPTLVNLLYLQRLKQETNFNSDEEIFIKNYLELKRYDLVYYGAHFFIGAKDYYPTSMFLKEIYPFNLSITPKIVEKLKIRIIDTFNISPQYYLSFSYLLDNIYQISHPLSNLILLDISLKKILYNSFKDEQVIDQLAGLQNLLVVIEKINIHIYHEIITMEDIKKTGVLENIKNSDLDT